MSGAIPARQLGDNYQSLVFWKYANMMLKKGSEIEKIVFEDDVIKSFDDIVVYYAKPRMFRSSDIDRDYIQVKFNMAKEKMFTIDNLLDPSFINAKKYSLLEADYNELKNKYAKLEEDYNGLVEFKNAIEDKEKDELIKSFYMLSDEDKKDVIENKSKYSKDEIEAKLSVICVRKKVNFDLDDSSKNEDKVEKEEDAAVTYTLDDVESSVPAWISALRHTQKSRKE